MKKLPNFQGLSFTCNPDELNDNKKHKELSSMVGKLKGTWKLSYGDKVNYYIMPSSFFKKYSCRPIEELLAADRVNKDRMH